MKILAMCPNPNDATSFYRGMGPLTAMVKQFDDVRVLAPGERVETYEWSMLRQADVVFLQRPCTEGHLYIAKNCKRMGVPLWIDYDDDLLNVPKHNPAYGVHSATGAKNVIYECLSMADLVTLSTQPLYSYMRGWCKNPQLIQNAFDDVFYLKRFKERKPEDRQKIIVWRGSATHENDLRIYADAVVEANHAHPDWQWCFFGYDPWFITERLRPGSFHTATWPTTVQYLDAISGFNYAIQFVALSDTPFNRCKSDIAYLEATWAGAVTVGPAWWEAHMIDYDHTPTGARNAIANIVGCSPEERDEIAADAWKSILEHRRLSKANEQRRFLIESIL